MFDSKYKSIPKKYLISLHQRPLINTDTLRENQRNRGLHRANFNKCEKCGYDLFLPSAYQTTTLLDYRHPYRGYVHYYNNHRMVLCDKCVDEKNGHPWTERG